MTFSSNAEVLKKMKITKTFIYLLRGQHSKFLEAIMKNKTWRTSVSYDKLKAKEMDRNIGNRSQTYLFFSCEYITE